MRLTASMFVTAALLFGCGGAEQVDETPAAPETAGPSAGATDDRTVTALAGPYYYAQSWDNGKRLTVCADSLTVHRPNGSTCTLRYPQTFTVYSGGGEWVSGHAWGDCGVDGQVQNGWFC